MRHALAIALTLAPLAAQAQQPAPEMAVVPFAAVENAILDVQAIVRLHPELATPALAQHFGALSACLADNPRNGRVMRQGADECPAVTEALAARDRALAAKQKPAADKPPTKP